jgi:hypothetical protein
MRQRSRDCLVACGGNGGRGSAPIACAEALEQARKALEVPVINGDELEAHSVAGFYMVDYGASTNLPFIRKKVELNASADALFRGRFHEQAAHAEITNARKSFAAVSGPERIDVFVGFNTRNTSTEVS